MQDWTIDLARKLTVGELAERTGVSTSALRFYEDRGLLRPDRNEVGHRRFPRPLVRRVAFIIFAQRVGFTLEEIRSELDKLPTDHMPTSDDWDQLTELWSSRIDERIRELRHLKRGLTNCIGCGCLSLESCTILNPDDKIGNHGPGPRFWMGDRRPRIRGD